MKSAGNSQARRGGFGDVAGRSAHHAHGIHAKPLNATNQLHAPHVMIQPLNAVASAAARAVSADTPSRWTRRNAPVAKSMRWTIETAAALPASVSGNFQSRTMQRFKKTEKVPN